MLATRAQHAVTALATCKDLAAAAELLPAPGDEARAPSGASRLAEKLTDAADVLQGPLSINLHTCFQPANAPLAWQAVQCACFS